MQVSSSASFPGVHSCAFTVVPVDQLLVACITTTRSTAVYGTQEATAGEVLVYRVSEEMYGGGKLSVKHQQSIEVESPVDLEMWYVLI